MCTVHPNSRAGGLSAWVVRRAELDHSVGRMARRELPPLMPAIFTGFTVPITTPQILWVNMVTPDALGPVIFFVVHTARTADMRVFLDEVERRI